MRTRWYYRPSIYITLLFLFLLLFVWPTEYRYEHSNGQLVRINRWSGEARYLVDGKFILKDSIDKQRSLYDKAAEALRLQGKSVDSALGPRP